MSREVRKFRKHAKKRSLAAFPREYHFSRTLPV